MKIFYVNKDEFIKTHSKEEMSGYSDIDTTTDKRFWEHSVGRYLVKNVAKTIYGIDNPEVVLSDSGKPVFKNSDLFFSISHSNNIIIVCFDEVLCGIDIEFIKERNFERLSEYYDTEFTTKDKFYKFWTHKEAVYKMGEDENYSRSFKFEDNYYLTVVSKNPVDETIKPEKWL